MVAVLQMQTPAQQANKFISRNIRDDPAIQDAAIKFAMQKALRLYRKLHPFESRKLHIQDHAATFFRCDQPTQKKITAKAFVDYDFIRRKLPPQQEPPKGETVHGNTQIQTNDATTEDKHSECENKSPTLYNWSS